MTTEDQLRAVFGDESDDDMLPPVTGVGGVGTAVDAIGDDNADTMPTAADAENTQLPDADTDAANASTSVPSAGTEPNLDALFGSSDDENDAQAAGAYERAQNRSQPTCVPNVATENADSRLIVDSSAVGAVGVDVQSSSSQSTSFAQPPQRTIVREVAQPVLPMNPSQVEMFLVDLPESLAISRAPYERPDDPHRSLPVAHVLRWRYTTGAADGQPEPESNARLVRWSDGSMDVIVGNEILEGKTSELPPALVYQYVRQGDAGSTALLEGHASLARRLALVPGTQQSTSRAVVERVGGSAIKLMHATHDPERDKKEKEMLEEQRIQMRDRQRGVVGRRSSASFSKEYLEQDEEQDSRSESELEAEGDIGAIKERYGSKAAKRRRQRRATSDADDERITEAKRRNVSVKKHRASRISATADDDDDDDNNGASTMATATTDATSKYLAGDDDEDNDADNEAFGGGDDDE